MNGADKKTLLRNIFVYHGIVEDQGLKKIWEKDLEHFFTDEIQVAWDEWRMAEVNQFRKPKPYDLIKIIYRYRKSKIVPHNTPDILVKGISMSTDILIENLEKMEANMPDVRKRMREAITVYEKLTIGLCALGLDKVKNPEAYGLAMHIASKIG